ncbi:hypothetical protein, partial [Escherichia coli]|uniref:hypothetical protein n=1 Tax=Escherichia coli TaxID=562 RepID=UPI00207C24DE
AGNMMNRAGWYRRHRAAGRQYATATMTRTVSYRRRQRMRRAAGQLQSQHLNSLVYDRDYGWNDNGDLVRISGPRQTREYGYSATGRLESVRTLAPDLDIRIPYA